ncbi:membrane protein [Microbacterium mangrovi]|uniref:Membrane protein n=1 Tax=Microbacterium mangrovi TaxID=1348253 RepID=A0A0B2A8B6_9MICO|nr:AEC family transporter [Microbacterium mangrovi]KHK97752.1 membrane protein [Microbacterium mangrovi]
MGGVLTGFGIISFVILVGYLAGRFQVGGANAANVLNRLAFFIATPALLFVTLAHADLKIVFSAHLVVAGVSAAVAAGIFVLASRIAFPKPATTTAIGALGASYVNANNIGLPVAVYVLGSASFAVPVLLFQLIFFAPVALTVLDVTSRGQASIRTILTQPLRNPMILASAAGIIVDLAGWQLPSAVYEPFVLLGGAAVPMVLLAFGMSLHGARPLRTRSSRTDIIVAVVVKSVVMPAIAFVVAHVVLGVHGHELFAMVALAALPTAQNVYNFAARFEQAVDVARDVVLVTTIAAIPVLLVVAAVFAG